jgi:hypothetical protein
MYLPKCSRVYYFLEERHIQHEIAHLDGLMIILEGRIIKIFAACIV